MPTDETVEDLLRRAFDDARGEGRRLELHGLHAGARERAQRRRRRRALLTTAGSGLAAAAVVAAVVVVPGLAHRQPHLLPATPSRTATSTTPATAGPAAYGGAYEIPDVLPEHLPAGLAQPSASVPMHTRDPQLTGNLGSCDWSGEVRKPVAGRDWQLYDSSSWRAGLSVAGFTTGTGAQAMRELVDTTLACHLPGTLAPVAWPGTTSTHFLATTSGDPRVPDQQAIAVIRVGDLLVAGFASDDAVWRASETARSLAEEAATRLAGFAPAQGKPLGTSTQAPNAASRPGAVTTRAPDPRENAYALGEQLFPSTTQLGHGMRYHSVPIDGPLTPAASGAQVCDSVLVAEAKGVAKDHSPHPVAGTQNEAWAGSGSGGVVTPTVTVTVTGWKTGTGAARFADLQKNRGSCVWLPEQERVSWPGADPSRTWLSRSVGGGLQQYLASQRVGDLIVSVVVGGLPGDEEKGEAIRLSDLVAGRVRASGLPAAEGR
ncbi:hypothetical protein [Oryzihumus sp.]